MWLVNIWFSLFAGVTLTIALIQTIRNGVAPTELKVSVHIIALSSMITGALVSTCAMLTIAALAATR